MATKTSVPLASANIAFFWKMKQLAVIDMNETATYHKIKGVYALRKNDGTTANIALWINTDTSGNKQLNVDLISSIPTTHKDQTFSFDDDACSIWLDKGKSGTTQPDQIVIGTGDIRGIATSGGNVTRVDLAAGNITILTCGNDFEITVHAVTIPSLTEVSSTLVKN